MSLGPDKGRGVGVVGLDESIDVLPELVDGCEGSAAERLTGEDGEPDLDLVEPGGAGWREVEVDIGMSREPCPSFLLWVLRLSRTAWICLSG